MEVLNFDKILAYYERRLPLAEEEEVEKEIFSTPENILILLGLKRIDERLTKGESITYFLEKKQEEIKSKIFSEK